MASNLSSLSAYKMAARPPRLYKGQWVGMRNTIRPTWHDPTFKVKTHNLKFDVFTLRARDWGSDLKEWILTSLLDSKIFDAVDLDPDPHTF